MQPQQNLGVQFYTFGLFDRAGIPHAVFTRLGGISPPPWASLNVGGTVGDEPRRVRENRERSFRAVNRDPVTIFDVWQVHGTDAVRALAPRQPDAGYTRGDILLTDRKAVSLFMRFADCVPVLLADRSGRAVGMVHAGWKGTVKGAAGSAVESFCSLFGIPPEDILAGIGPSIGPDHYEIGADVAALVQDAFPEQRDRFLRVVDGSTYFDLWEANRWQLQSAGVRDIEMAGMCTACQPRLWYSHRGERGQTGRFGALIAVPAPEASETG